VGRSPEPVGFIHFIHKSGRSGRIPSRRISSRLSRTIPTSTVVAFAPRGLTTGSLAAEALAAGALALGAPSAVARESAARAVAVRPPAIPVPMAPIPAAHPSVVPTPLIRRFETDSNFESISGPERGSSDSNFERSPKRVRSPASLAPGMRHPEAWCLEIRAREICPPRRSVPGDSLPDVLSRTFSPGYSLPENSSPGDWLPGEFPLEDAVVGDAAPGNLVPGDLDPRDVVLGEVALGDVAAPGR